MRYNEKRQPGGGRNVNGGAVAFKIGIGTTMGGGGSWVPSEPMKTNKLKS